MPIYAAGPRPATMTLAPTSRRCIKHTLDRYLPLRSSTTKQRNSADPTPQIIARIASRPVSPDSSRAQISIAPARHRPTFPDRGFLPWRLSDAGRRCTWHRRVRPASETLHRNGLTAVTAFLTEHGRAASSTPLPQLVACKADGSACAADAECCSGVCKPIGEGRACVSK